MAGPRLAFRAGRRTAARKLYVAVGAALAVWLGAAGADCAGSATTERCVRAILAAGRVGAGKWRVFGQGLVELVRLTLA